MVAPTPLGSRDRILLKSLESLLVLTRMLPLSDFRFAEDFVGKNGTIMIRKGQSLTPSWLEYLKNHDSYVSHFVFERTEAFYTFCAQQIKNALQQLIAHRRTAAMTYGVVELGKEISLLLEHVLANQTLAFTLFSQRYLEGREKRELFDHLMLTGVLTVCIARNLDPGFRDVLLASKAMTAGLIHDLEFGDYYKKVKEGLDAVQESSHAERAAQRAGELELTPEVVFPVRYHHSYAREGFSLPEADNSIAGTLHSALSVAECFVTLVDFMQNATREAEALFATANYASAGRLNAAAVTALGELIRSRDILLDVARITAMESQCVHGCAHAYPKRLGSVPTEIICNGGPETCPYIQRANPQLIIVRELRSDANKEQFLTLQPGAYYKCQLGVNYVTAHA